MDFPGIILVNDHRLFRSGLKYLLEGTGYYHIIEEASNGKEFLDRLSSIIPDLVIIDNDLPDMNGIEAARIALTKYPALKILILSISPEFSLYTSMLDYGIKGFLLKDADANELFHAMARILDGETYFSQDLLMTIIRDNNKEQAVKLSSREREILDLMCSGLSNHEISASLKLSKRTVERHRTNLLDKTGSRNSIQLVVYALKHKLINI